MPYMLSTIQYLEIGDNVRCFQCFGKECSQLWLLCLSVLKETFSTWIIEHLIFKEPQRSSDHQLMFLFPGFKYENLVIKLEKKFSNHQLKPAFDHNLHQRTNLILCYNVSEMIKKLKTNSEKKWKLGYCEVLLNEDTYNMVVKYIYVKIWTIAPGNPVFA